MTVKHSGRDTKMTRTEKSRLKKALEMEKTLYSGKFKMNPRCNTYYSEIHTEVVTK